MTTLVSIKLTCPVCRTAFDSRSMASGVTIGQDTDFRKHYAGYDPLAFQVHVCPQCRFAAFEGDFEEVQDLVKEHVLAGDFLEAVPAARQEGELPGSTKYMLAAACYRHDSRATFVRLADLNLRASWCARTESRRQREKQCQIESIVEFEKALEGADPLGDQRTTVLYLLGELYRRVGRHEFAITMFDRVLEELGPETDTQFVDLVRRQRTAAEGHRSENMVIE
jgi:uncharacterized protein (DUF2225 family)